MPSVSTKISFWLVLLVLVVLLVFTCTKYEPYNDFVGNHACNSAMASAMATRMASLGDGYDYSCLGELLTGSRIVHTGATHTKHVGAKSARALGHSHAKVERNNARHAQNKDIISSTRVNANDLTSITTGKLNSPTSNSYSASTGSKTVQEQLREQQAEINTLKERLKQHTNG